jgi:hypothetical protein
MCNPLVHTKVVGKFPQGESKAEPIAFKGRRASAGLKLERVRQPLTPQRPGN